MKRYILLACFAVMLLCPFSMHASSDTCTVNDFCNSAIDLPDVIPNGAFTCINACNVGATPETTVQNECGIHNTPTVWFRFYTTGTATLLNLHVSSQDFSAPVISMYSPNPDCSSLNVVPLTSAKLPCVTGSDGIAEAIGTDIGASIEYYIAISTASGETGDFQLCFSTISVGSVCALERNIEITARSFDGPLSGPFYPGEKVSFCLNVVSYTAIGNGCQWFQGIVPVFGNGWDPASFDGNGQPLNATVNSNSMGIPDNGIYGVATWDWFTDVTYHHDHEFLQIGDFDNSGTLDMCHTQYEFGCANIGGLQGGCCGPCWDVAPGAKLPGGWFAYGINGSCTDPGPPIRVDWGDGNTCSDGMGPWSFCFDLTIRPYPECLDDSGLRNLGVSFFTQADGEIGAWTGGASVCALDQPAKVIPALKCVEQVIDLGIDTLIDLCEGDTLLYQIMFDNVSNWTWTISPFGYIQDPVYQGPNGFVIEKEVLNPGNGPQTITFHFTGQVNASSAQVIKQVVVRIWPEIELTLPRDIVLCEKDSTLLLITPEHLIGGTGNYTYLWSPSGSNAPELIIGNTVSTYIGLIVTDEAGCTARDDMRVTFKPCLGDDNPIDDNNDPPKPQDPPLPGGNFSGSTLAISSSGYSADEPSGIRIYPVPSQDFVIITLSGAQLESDRITLTDINGVMIRMLLPDPIFQKHFKQDITDLLPGVYYITYSTDKKVATVKIVKL